MDRGWSQPRYLIDFFSQVKLEAYSLNAAELSHKMMGPIQSGSGCICYRSHHGEERASGESPPRRTQGDCVSAFPIFNRGISTIATMNIVMPTPVIRMP